MGHANDGMMRLRAAGAGAGRDAARAVRALRRAAKLQDPSGWAGLAYAHLYGAGVKQSDEMAVRAMCTNPSPNPNPNLNPSPSPSPNPSPNPITLTRRAILGRATIGRGSEGAG